MANQCDERGEEMGRSIEYDNYLAHYGVKGMKWGVRKKSSKASADSKEATAAKKKAKKSGSESLSNKELKTIQERRNLEKNARVYPKDRSKTSADARDVGGIKKTVNKKGTKALSNDELQAAITRMELEKKYSDLTKGDSKTSSGKEFISGIMKDAFSNIATSAMEDMMRNAGGAAAGAARKRYDARRAPQSQLRPGQRSIGR